MSECLGSEKHWVDTTIGMLGRLHCGQSPSSADVNTNGDGVPYVTGPEQWDGCNIIESKWTTDPRRIAPSNSIFITVKGSVGEMFPGIVAAIGRDIYAFEPADEMSMKFVYYALQYSVQDVVQKARGDIPGLTKSHILDHPISVPGSKQQRLIASKIDELFSRIDEGERALVRVQKLVERYRQSVLKAAVTGELTREWRDKQANSGAPIETGEALLARILTARREAWEQAELGKMKAKGIKPKDGKWKQKYKEPSSPDTTDLPELPAGWVWASVSQVCGEFGNGLSKKPSHTPPGYPILRISAVRPLAVDAEDIRYYPSEDIESLDGFLVNTGDLLFTRYNGSKELVGVSGVFHGAEPVLHPDKLIRARVVSEHLVSPEYLAITLNCGWSKKHLDQWVKTSAGQHGIAGSDIKRAPFPLPSIAEQLQILEIVEVALSKCGDAKSTCSAQLRRSGAVRQSILKSAFAGALIAQDSSDEPAATLIERITSERRASPAKPQRSPKIKKNASK